MPSDGRREVGGISQRFWGRSKQLSGHARCLIVVIISALSAAGIPASAGEHRDPDLEMGARLVEARCVFCHKEESLPDLVEGCTHKHGESYLDEFLKLHHAPDTEARADIIAYLTCPPHLLPAK